jgi:diguanylate cyclase (GGDEF)-like protein/PAS domain S-box-containing protein
MYRVINCISNDHDAMSVALAIFICLFSATCSMLVFQRGQVSPSLHLKRLWAGASGAIIGLGIWATHFVAMLGYDPGFDVAFDGRVTVLSALIVTFGFLSISQILITGLSPARRVLCAAIACASVTGMHYYGVSALRVSGLFEFDTDLVITSIIVCGLCFSLAYTVGLSETRTWPNLLGLAFTSCAVAGLHFIGATAVVVIPINGLFSASWVIGSDTVGLWVTVVIIVIIVIAGLAAGLDSTLVKFHSRQKQRLSILADVALESLFIVSPEGEILDSNTASEKLLGIPRSEIRGQNAAKLLKHTDLSLKIDSNNKEWGERSLKTADGRYVPVMISRRSVNDGKRPFTVIAVRDISERQKFVKEIKTLAFEDQLTGLANRAAFQRQAVSVIEQKNRTEPVGILLFDLDNFKSINDQFGHGAGDIVLKKVASRLKKIVSHEHLLARLGGDEFAILISHAADEIMVLQLAENCLKAINRDIRIERRQLSSSASIGVAITDDKRQTLTALMTSADRALYAAKEDGRGCVRFYDEVLHIEQETKRELEVALRRACKGTEFELYYQPKVAAKTRQIVGYEALIRWNRPGHGMVFPDAFIPIAEQSQLINQIGDWTIKTACLQAKFWPNDQSVSVNLSGRQFMDPNLVSTVRSALKDSGLKPNRLELEITETALIQNPNIATSVLDKLKKIGVKIALDDFGTGYSSMSYVRQFSFDRIKIDRSFVNDLGQDNKASSIIDTIVFLGESLKIPIVAEGVETEDQAKYLSAISCGELQGYLIARPMPHGRTLSLSRTKERLDAA